MYEKLMLKLRTYLFELNTYDLITKIINNDSLLLTLAKEELFKRDLHNLQLSSNILETLVNKFSIEEIWYLSKLELNDDFKKIIIIKLNQLLDYYQNLNLKDFLAKSCENKKIFKLLK